MSNNGTFLGDEYIYLRATSRAQIIVAERPAEVGTVYAAANSSASAAMLSGHENSA